MKKILLYIILFLSGIDGAWALPIEKEGMSIYSPSLKQEVSYSIILPEGYEHSDTEYPVLYMFHGIGGDYTSWLEYGNVARDRKSTRLNSSHIEESRMPSSA